MKNEQVRSPEFRDWLDSLPGRLKGRVVRLIARAAKGSGGEILANNILGYTLNTVTPKLYFVYKAKNGKTSYLIGGRLADKQGLIQEAGKIMRRRGL